MIKKLSQFFLAIFILGLFAYTPNAQAESYAYIKNYFQGFHWSKERLRSRAPGNLWLRREYGLLNRFNMPYNFKFDFNIKVLCGVCSFSDPPEELHYDVKLSRVQFDWLKVGLGHGRKHYISIGDVGSYAGYGEYVTYVEVGILFGK